MIIAAICQSFSIPRKDTDALCPVSSLFDFNSDRIEVRILEILIHSCYYFMFYWLVGSIDYPLDFLIFSFSLFRRFRSHFRSFRLFR